MNNFKLIVKLMLPYYLLVRLTKRHNVIMPTVGANAVTRLMYGILPAFIAIINGQKKHTDRRTIKYWFPYGVMKKHVASHYGILISSPSDKTGWKTLRACVSFGLILWWDAEKLRIRNRQATDKQVVPTKRPMSGTNEEKVLTPLFHSADTNTVFLQTIQGDIASLRNLIENEMTAQRRMIETLKQEHIRGFENLQADFRRRLEMIEIEVLRLQQNGD